MIHPYCNLFQQLKPVPMMTELFVLFHTKTMNMFSSDLKQINLRRYLLFQVDMLLLLHF